MDAILATIPAIQVNVSAVAGYLILAALSAALFTVVGILLSNKRKLSELWEVHLGIRAIGTDGIPRWYIREEEITKALDRVDTTIAAFANVQGELIQELRLDRVERKTRLNAAAATKPPGA